MTTAPDVYRALWRHRFMIVFLTILATAVAYVGASSQRKTYRASTLVRVEQPTSSTDPQQQDNALGVAQHLAQTYAQIVSTRAIGDQVHTFLGGRVPRSEINISGSPVADLELMNISATSHLPSVAAAAANAAPVVLRQFIAKAGGTHDLIVTINPATVPAAAIAPRPTRTAFLALVVALALNGGLALLFEFLRDRLPESDEIGETFGTPVLATIPKLSLTRGSVRARSGKTVAPKPASAAVAKDTR